VRYQDGRYEVEITDQGFVEAKSGTMQFVLAFDVKGMVDPKDPDKMFAVQPGNRKYYKAITENTLQWFMDDLRALGVAELSSFALLDPATEGHISLIGRTADMQCGSRTGNDGKSYEDWSPFRAAGPAKPIDRVAINKVKTLDRLFGAALAKPAAASGSSRRTPVPVAAAAKAAAVDDNIPF
jgi:hypothetical protein